VIPAEQPRRTYVFVAIAVVSAVCLSSLLSINTFPVVSNDSVVYIEHSLDLTEGGWVTEGYRQVGYPATIAQVRWLATLVGAEPLLAVAVLQRLLLVLAGALSFIIWRWWSLPLLLFLAAGSTVASSNFLLTEGMGLPVAILLVFPTLAYIRAVRSDMWSRRVLVLGITVIVGALYLFFVRLTYGVFGVLPLVLVLASWKTVYRRFSLVAFGVFVSVAGLFALLVSFDNEQDLGVRSPIAGDEATTYYHAWSQVFVVNPENRSDPDLASFYDDGVVHAFSRELSGLDLSSEEQEERYDAEIRAMLEAAGMSVPGSQIQAALWALIGGRLHDIEGAVNRVISSSRENVDDLINLNEFAFENGPMAFAEVYNDSQLPEAVITDPVGVPLNLNNQKLLAVLMPMALAALILALVWPDARLGAVAGLVVVLATAIGLGLIRADNLRFLIAANGFGIAMAIGLLQGHFTHRISQQAV
jgi:hypothetical protein